MGADRKGTNWRECVQNVERRERAGSDDGGKGGSGCAVDSNCAKWHVHVQNKN